MICFVYQGAPKCLVMDVQATKAGKVTLNAPAVVGWPMR